MKKIVAFSLWGNDPKYCVGAIRNAQLVAKHYPGWVYRIYIGSFTPSWVTDELTGLTKNWVRYFEMNGIFEPICSGSHDEPEMEIYDCKDTGWHGMFWRFLPASDDEVDVFISRDCDSRVSAREASAVNEWMAGPHLVHSMADHPYHFNPKFGLMGGMFGMKRHACPQMMDLIVKFKDKYPDAWQCDQDFLRDYVYPLVARKIHPTSDLHPGCDRFPLPREYGAFVGEILGPNEEILHPEHRVLRGN